MPNLPKVMCMLKTVRKMDIDTMRSWISKKWQGETHADM
jgi:hypothetical protein